MSPPGNPGGLVFGVYLSVIVTLPILPVHLLLARSYSSDTASSRGASVLREFSRMPATLLLLLAGFMFSRLEDIPLSDTFYFTFITGLSLGYGDITPKSG